MYECKYCGAKTQNSGCVCSECKAKLKLIRQIKAMLMPVYQERRKNGGYFRFW